MRHPDGIVDAALKSCEYGKETIACEAELANDDDAVEFEAAAELTDPELLATVDDDAETTLPEAEAETALPDMDAWLDTEPALPEIDVWLEARLAELVVLETEPACEAGELEITDCKLFQGRTITPESSSLQLAKNIIDPGTNNAMITGMMMLRRSRRRHEKNPPSPASPRARRGTSGSGRLCPAEVRDASITSCTPLASATVVPSGNLVVIQPSLRFSQAKSGAGRDPEVAPSQEPPAIRVNLPAP